MNNLDLSGKILFKVKLDNEIKKLMIHNDDLNYNDLILMLQRIFSNKIKQNDEFTIKYTDDENDLITITDDSDVSLALQTSKVLKLTIFLNDQEQEAQALNPEDIVSELKQIRQSIDKFLSNFGKSLKLENKIEDLTKSTDDIKIVHQVNPEVQKEFDPLNKRIELNSTHLQKQSRAQTPDSIGSSEMTGSITPRLQHNQQFHQAHPQIHPQYQAQAPQVPQQQVHQPSFVQNQQQLTQHQQQQQQPQQSQTHPGMGTPGQFLQNPALKAPSQVSFPGQVNPQQQQQPQVLPGQQQGMQQQQTNPQMDQQQYYQQQQQHHHYQQPGIPQQGQGMPQQGPVMQQQAQGMPQQGTSMLQQGQGMPQQGPGMTQQGMPMSMSPMSSMNPYSKNPNVSLARPPSATLYQQGYK